MVHFLFNRCGLVSLKMLFIIGLGLADEKDITVKGLQAVKTCSKVFLEADTSLLLLEKEKLVTWNDVDLMVGGLLWQIHSCR